MMELEKVDNFYIWKLQRWVSFSIISSRVKQIILWLSWSPMLWNTSSLYILFWGFE